jgi:hypothetical protein
VALPQCATSARAASRNCGGCLLHDRDRARSWPVVEGDTPLAPDPEWVDHRFYCPAAAPRSRRACRRASITHDIELDLPRLKERLASGELEISGNRLVHKG